VCAVCADVGGRSGEGWIYSLVIAAAKTQSAPKGDRNATTLAGPWDVDFPAADAAATFASLVSWTQHEREPIRHYAGTARYRKPIDIPAE
jgi:hypothetical protein